MSAPAPSPTASAMLDVSRATVDLLIRRGTTDLPIKEMALNAGISERTFYRYFPRKEDAIRPFLLTGLHRILTNFNNRPAHEPILDSLDAVWSDAWPLKHPESSAVLYRILESEDSFRAIRLQVVVDSETLWAKAIARRLNIAAGSPHAIFAGAAIITAFRMAWQACSHDPSLDPRATLLANFHLFNESLLNPPG